MWRQKRTNKLNTAVFLVTHDGSEMPKNNFEPRINLQQVLASPDLDRNSYALKILFYVVGSNQPVEVETFLERLR